MIKNKIIIFFGNLQPPTTLATHSQEGSPHGAYNMNKMLIIRGC